MRILVIEDESIIARRVSRMSKAFFGNLLKSIEHVDNLEEGLDYLNNNSVDLLLLDLNLNGENGFELLKKMVSRDFHTIVVSAYKERAIEAFEYGVLDFVPKPFNEQRLSQAFARITAKKKVENSGLKYLSIQKKGSQHLLEVKDISHIKGARIYTEIFLKNNKVEVHNKSLDRLLAILPASFERIHKSYIVDMHQVSNLEVSSGGKYTLILKNGKALPVGRSRYKVLKEKWFK